jgi:methyl-accepting chemotaxis protein
MADRSGVRRGEETQGALLKGRLPLMRKMDAELFLRDGEIMKIILLTVTSVLVCLAVLSLSTLAQAETMHKSAAQDLLIKSEVQTAASMLQAIYAKHQRGEMTLEQAKKLGADLLRDLRYGKDGYFWADTTEGVNVVLYGRKDVEGRNRLENRDSNGTYYIKEFMEKGKEGGGYVEYLFPRRGRTHPQPKRSYVLLFKPFQWVIGSGYYR